MLISPIIPSFRPATTKALGRFAPPQRWRQTWSETTVVGEGIVNGCMRYVYIEIIHTYVLHDI